MRGHIVKRPSGNYAVVLYLGRDASGKKKQNWVTVQGNKRDAHVGQHGRLRIRVAHHQFAFIDQAIAVIVGAVHRLGGVTHELKHERTDRGGGVDVDEPRDRAETDVDAVRE